MVPPEELNPSSRVMEHHQRSPEGNMLITNTMAREKTGIDVDATGSSGMAGLMELCAVGAVGPEEAVGVLFTGVKR